MGTMASVTETYDLIDYLKGAMITTSLWKGRGVTITESAFAILKTMTPHDPKSTWDDFVKRGTIVIVPDNSQDVPVRPLINTTLPKPPTNVAMSFQRTYRLSLGRQRSPIISSVGSSKNRKTLRDIAARVTPS